MNEELQGLVLLLVCGCIAVIFSIIIPSLYGNKLEKEGKDVNSLQGCFKTIIFIIIMTVIACFIIKTLLD